MFCSSVPWVQPCDDCSRRDTLESLEHTTTYWRQQRFCPPAPLDVQNDWRTRPPGFNFIPISSYRHMDQIDSSSNTATIEIPNHKCSPVHRHPFLFTSVPRAWTDVKHKNTRKEPPLFFPCEEHIDRQTYSCIAMLDCKFRMCRHWWCRNAEQENSLPDISLMGAWNWNIAAKNTVYSSPYSENRSFEKNSSARQRCHVMKVQINQVQMILPRCWRQ